MDIAFIAAIYAASILSMLDHVWQQICERFTNKKETK